MKAEPKVTTVNSCRDCPDFKPNRSNSQCYCYHPKAAIQKNNKPSPRFIGLFRETEDSFPNWCPLTDLQMWLTNYVFDNSKKKEFRQYLTHIFVHYILGIEIDYSKTRSENETI